MTPEDAQVLRTMTPLPIEDALLIAADGLNKMVTGKAILMAREAGLDPHEQAVYAAGVQAAADELRLTVREILTAKSTQA